MSLPPAQPVYILRGHTSQIHATVFIRTNTRLLTGDADGWVVLWSLETRRPVAVWRAHDNAILGLGEWGQDRLITHGKDNKLIIWKLRREDEPSMSTVLPIDDTASTRAQPWLLHILEVNTLNFCSFAYCNVQGQSKDMGAGTIVKLGIVNELLLAVPNTISSEAVDIFHLPSERRIHTVQADVAIKTGLVMAVAIFYQDSRLTIVVGYESGHAMVSQSVDGREWHILYVSKPHSQPVLSFDLNPSQSFFITSSADSIIAKHPIPTIIQSDRSFSGETYEIPSGGGSLLSQCIAPTGPFSSKGKGKDKDVGAEAEMQTTPLQISLTRHSGQQGLRIRSDGKIFATAGWDARVRVYSVQSLRELAVLKWHKDGCYAVAFAQVSPPEHGAQEPLSPGVAVEASNAAGDQGKTTDLVMSASGITTLVKHQRVLKAMTRHWLAAGGKDGKVSLWDIY